MFFSKTYRKFAFLALIPAVAHAYSWQDYEPALKARAEEFIASADIDPGCRDQAREVASDVSEYYLFALRNDSANSGYRREGLGVKLSGDPDSLCYRSKFFTAVAVSADLLTEFDFKGAPDPHLGAVARLFALLVKNSVIEILDQKQRFALGGLWTKRFRSKTQNSYLAIGGYDCNATRIYIDPSMAPMDLGSILIHELDHLFRDKLLTPGPSAKTGAPSGTMLAARSR